MSAILLVGVDLWDGTGAPIREDVDIRIEDGRIAAVGRDLPREGAQLLDAAGTTALPGLIDAHVHLSMDPGAAWRAPDAPGAEGSHLAAIPAHLRAYLACGVTTVVDPAVLPGELSLIRAALHKNPGPRYLPLGIPFSPPGGYVAAVIPEFPAVADAQAVEAQFRQMEGLDLAGIKVTMEDGFYRPIWPMHSDDVLAAIRAGAEARGLPIYVHAISPAEQLRALQTLSPHAMVHPLDRPDRRAVAALAAAGTYEVTTLATSGMMRFTGGSGDDPASGWPIPGSLLPVIPADELRTAADPQTAARFAGAMIDNTFPHLPMSGLIARSGLPRRQAEARLRHTGAALRAMRDAGIPLVMGSDAGNWPVIPYLFHGPSSLLELGLIVEAGFSTEEALLMATRTAAQMLGMEREIGAILPGYAADLVVIEGDRLQGAHFPDLPIRWTIRAGEARTPAGWLEVGD